MMQDREDLPKWAFKFYTERGRVLDCAQERIQVHTKRTKEKFIREGIMLQTEHGLLSKTENKGYPKSSRNSMYM